MARVSSAGKLSKKPTTKKTKRATLKKPVSSSSYNDSVEPPTTKEMIIGAITGLKDRNGSSVPAIKKFISAAYGVDGGEMLPHIKKCLQAGLSTGEFVQPKTSGLYGNFKLGTESIASKSTIKKAVASKTKSLKQASSPKKSTLLKSSPKKASPKKSSPKKTQPKKSSPASKKKKTPTKIYGTSKMAIEAIAFLKNKSGVNFRTIKQFIVVAFKAKDDEKLVAELKKSLKAGVKSGILIQPVSGGLNGTFKLAKPLKQIIKTKEDSKMSRKSTPKTKSISRTTKNTPTKPKKSRTKAKKSITKPKAKKVATKKSPTKSKKTAAK